MRKQQILEAYLWRHACKEFDSSKKISQEDFDFLLKVMSLSPSSFGLQPYEIFILQNQNLINELHPHMWGGKKQLPSASHIIMFATKKDITVHDSYIEDMITKVQQSPSDILELKRKIIHDHQTNEIGMQDKRNLIDWGSKQVYIALGNLMSAAAEIGIDSCAIEGFTRKDINPILVKYQVIDLDKYEVSVFCSLGYRLAEPLRPKLRKDINQLVRFIK